MKLYTLGNVIFRYGTTFRLAVTKLEIAGGSTIGFTGANGSGKTTLLKLLAFLISPASGDLLFNGSKQTPAPGTVTMLFQQPYLLKRSVYENIAFGLKMTGKKGKATRVVPRVLEKVGLEPDRFMHRKWYQLSGGEAKRVGLAARIALKPEVLILDEPMAGIDEQSGKMVETAISELRNGGNLTLLLSSHNRTWLETVCDTIYTISNGKIKSMENRG